jgi:hypothetical protein
VPDDPLEASLLVLTDLFRRQPLALEHGEVAEDELRAGLASPAEEFKPRSVSQLLDAFHLASLVD